MSRLWMFMLLGAMVSVQCGASLAKQLFPVFGAGGSTLMRLGLASCMLLSFSALKCLNWHNIRDRIVNRKSQIKESGAQILALPSFHILLHDLILVVPYGVAMGTMNLLFYQALERISLGLAVTLEFVGPLMIALFCSKSLLDLLWAVLAAIGVYLIFPVAELFSSFSCRGSEGVGALFALGAGVCWALYIYFGQRAGKRRKGDSVTTLGMLVATLTIIPLTVPQFRWEVLSLSLLPMALAIAFLSSALPYSIEMMVLKRLPANVFSILMCFEPVVAVLTGMVLLDETLSLKQWFAVFLIISAALGSTIRPIEAQVAPAHTLP